MITKTKMSIGPRLPYHFGEFYKQRLRNAFLAELGCLPQLAANIVILQTNAQYIDIFSSFYTLVIQFVFTQAKA